MEIKAKNSRGQKEKHTSFWLASQELMADGFQNEIDRLKRDIVGFKIENYNLRIACGDLHEKICSRTLKSEEGLAFKESMMSWGDLASFLSSKQMEFYYELLVFAVQKWIVSSGLTRIIMSPVQAFKERLFELLKQPSEVFERSHMDCIAMFTSSIICFREYDITHEDIKAIEQIFMGIVQTATDKNGSFHPCAEPLLTLLIDNDPSRCIITRTICKLCFNVSQMLSEEIISGTKNTDTLSDPDHDLMKVDFVKLCCLCQICISKLCQWPQSNNLQDVILEDITNHVWETSRNCDIFSALNPAMAFEGKRLYCRLIASLQSMGT